MQIEVLDTATKIIGSLALAYPFWLHQPQRIESLVCVVMVALFLFALIEREARRVVRRSGQIFRGLRAEGRDHLPVTGAQLVEAFAPLALVKQRLRLGPEIVTVLAPTTLSPPQTQILERLGVMTPEVYPHPAVTLHPHWRVREMSLARWPTA